MRRKCLIFIFIFIIFALCLPNISRASQINNLVPSYSTTTRVSVASDGSQSNNNSYSPSISANGRYIAFLSEANNLVNGDTNGHQDVFVYDWETGDTIRVSVASDGTQGNGESYSPTISADGRYVAFDSLSSNLVTMDTNGNSDIFVHDLQTSITMRTSIASDGTQGNKFSFDPSISADGRYVAFFSYANNLVSGDTNFGINAFNAFVHDRQLGITTRISAVSDYATSYFSSGSIAISADGRYVAFESHASNLVSEDTNSTGDIFVYDRQISATTRVSIASDGTQGNGESIFPSLSADGRFVVFSSNASNLVSEDTNGRNDIFVHDRYMETTTCVSIAIDGTKGNEDSYQPSISANGHYVAFESDASNLVSGDTHGWSDVFVNSLQTSQTTRISVDSYGNQGKGDSHNPSLSADGQYVSFASYASNLVTGDTNGYGDVFVHDLEGEENNWTLMFYLDGDNNLDRSYTPIVNQLEEAASNFNANTVAVWDRFGTNNSAYYLIQPNSDLSNLANYQDGVNQWSKGELNMGAEQTLIDFVNWAKENYPAEHYALILSDHGSGLGGGMWDETDNDNHLTVKQMGEALNTITSNGENKIDVLYLDACLMGMLEDAYQFRDSAIYYVASENLQWSFSEPYSSYISNITETTSPSDMASIFTNSYANVAQIEYDAYTMSAGDLSLLGAVISTTNTLARIINSNMASYAPTLTHVAEIVQRYEMNGDDEINENDDYVDLYDFALMLKGLSGDSQIDQACDAVMAAVDDYIVLNRNSDINYPKWDLHGSHGVSIFFPSTASSFYNSENYDFAVGATWPGNSGALTFSSEDETVEWGPMLVNYFQMTQPGGSDNPNPPEPIARLIPLSYVYIPIMVR